MRWGLKFKSHIKLNLIYQTIWLQVIHLSSWIFKYFPSLTSIIVRTTIPIHFCLYYFVLLFLPLLLLLLMLLSLLQQGQCSVSQSVSEYIGVWISKVTSRQITTSVVIDRRSRLRYRYSICLYVTSFEGGYIYGGGFMLHHSFPRTSTFWDHDVHAVQIWNHA